MYNSQSISRLTASHTHLIFAAHHASCLVPGLIRLAKLLPHALYRIECFHVAQYLEYAAIPRQEFGHIHSTFRTVLKLHVKPERR